MKLSVCRACRKPIVFAVVANKAGRPPGKMPLNPRPDPDGNVAAYQDVTGSLVGRVVGKGGDHLGYERIYMPHAATCEKRDPPAPPAPPEGVTFLDQWRKARSASAIAGRNRRGRRPAPPVTGIRVDPGRQP